MSVLVPEGQLENDDVFTSFARINSDMANLKEILSDDAYAKLEKQVEFAKTIRWVQKFKDSLGIFALPDGTYVPCAGPKNTRLWTDPDADWRYIEYDQWGCMHVVVEWPEDSPYADAIAHEQILSNGLCIYQSPERLQYGHEIGGCLEPGSSHGVVEAFIVACGY